MYCLPQNPLPVHYPGDQGRILPVDKPEMTENQRKTIEYPAQRQHTGLQRAYPKSWQRFTVDLRQAKHRRGILFFFASLFIIVAAVLIGSYKVYAYTESSEFCGTVCHSMDPQFARYKHSEHANVECVACHVGPGPDYYIKSKIEGARLLRHADEYLQPPYQKPGT